MDSVVVAKVQEVSEQVEEVPAQEQVQVLVLQEQEQELAQELAQVLEQGLEELRAQVQVRQVLVRVQAVASRQVVLRLVQEPVERQELRLSS